MARILEPIESAWAAELPVIYANDNYGTCDGDAGRLVKLAVEGRGGSLIEASMRRRSSTRSSSGPAASC